ncbi:MULTISPECIES: trp operon repressor [Actinobacillus]|uniref:Trp operon repressor homolog n=3 Tax=Actinobacillus TaxID=713 RepID=C5S2I9_9PAST|nr:MULTISPECIES: trp operon repressor [Actinobacillus]AWI51750.1 trp operon repressor [Actinobacillus porcitonsillarum]EER46861.1 Trp operon repressor [Actinobacillus minor NM305]EER48341.1 Trp operon repressor [Actinobacillus minor 202]MDD6910295.1 trp operon repressor [Actinobacillus minor]MDY4712319.1 trp operon repressor [Actinobacillus minor]
MKTVYHQRDPKEWQQFVTLLRQAVAEDKLTEFFELFLTADERGSLGLRTQIVEHLLKNESSQREIQQKLNTSAATITRGSNMLKTLDPQFLNWVNEKLNGKA